MIIDNHIHIFPDQAGPDTGPDPTRHVAQLQKSVADFWGRMVSSHTDPKFIPDPDEDVGFTVGRHGRYYWRKHGEACWLQRGPAFMTRMESTPEQIIAHMDAGGVDMAVIQADYDYVDFDTGRESYFLDAVRARPDRFLATAAVDYRLSTPTTSFKDRSANLTHAVEDYGFRALFLGGEAIPDQLDDPRCDPLWQEAARLGVPGLRQYWLLFQGQLSGAAQGPQISPGPLPRPQRHRSHVGGNLLHSSSPEFVETPPSSSRCWRPVGSTWKSDTSSPTRTTKSGAPTPSTTTPNTPKSSRKSTSRFGPMMVWGADLPWCYRTCTYQQNVDLVRLHTPYMTDKDRGLVLGGNLSLLLA